MRFKAWFLFSFIIICISLSLHQCREYSFFHPLVLFPIIDVYHLLRCFCFWIHYYGSLINLRSIVVRGLYPVRHLSQFPLFSFSLLTSQIVSVFWVIHLSVSLFLFSFLSTFLYFVFKVIGWWRVLGKQYLGRVGSCLDNNGIVVCYFFTLCRGGEYMAIDEVLLIAAKNIVFGI